MGAVETVGEDGKLATVVCTSLCGEALARYCIKEVHELRSDARREEKLMLGHHSDRRLHCLKEDQRRVPWTVRIQVRVFPLPQSFVDLMESSSTFLDGSTYYVVSPPYI